MSFKISAFLLALVISIGYLVALCSVHNSNGTKADTKTHMCIECVVCQLISINSNL